MVDVRLKAVSLTFPEKLLKAEKSVDVQAVTAKQGRSAANAAEAAVPPPFVGFTTAGSSLRRSSVVHKKHSPPYSAQMGQNQLSGARLYLNYIAPLTPKGV